LRDWRCDLTALSHQHNLYFLASVDELHVYQPSFPDQSLSDNPELVLHPPKSGAPGYGIDPSNPHSINRILVDYIGNEEMLMLACDDGDVIIYRTREIHRALERRTNVQEPASEDGIHVFVNCNVGKSAWGLAVQRKARMIAISAVMTTFHPHIRSAPLTSTEHSSDNDSRICTRFRQRFRSLRSQYRRPWFPT
jgi:hypothetical protein